MVWIWSIWLRLGTSGGLLWARWWTFEFRKMLGSSWEAAQLAATQEGLSSMSEWVSEWAQIVITRPILVIVTHFLEWLKSLVPVPVRSGGVLSDFAVATGCDISFAMFTKVQKWICLYAREFYPDWHWPDRFRELFVFFHGKCRSVNTLFFVSGGVPRLNPSVDDTVIDFQTCLLRRIRPSNKIRAPNKIESGFMHPWSRRT
jgi:hypothetical protein